MDKLQPTDWPKAFEPLWQPYRYKGAYGGRGGAKSHTFAEMMLARCMEAPIRCVCIREVQNTIKDSVLQLLKDKIVKLNMSHFFEEKNNEIHGNNGSFIIFKGMQAYNAENIKSLEGFDIAWVEEAQTLSDTSLRLLRPTIRKDETEDTRPSELWFSWNPRHDTDPIDKFFRSGHHRSSMISIQVNHDENPWFPKVLQTEMEEDFEIDPEMAEHVWNGGYEILSEASYYAKLLFKAEKENRVGEFPYEPGRELYTAWDIGVDDYTSIWFIQDDGLNAYIIDYFECDGIGAEDIVKAALPELNPNEMEKEAALQELGREVPYEYTKHFLPHDVKVREWGANARGRLQSLKALGVKPIKSGRTRNDEERINAVRRVLPFCYFDDNSRVKHGITRLRKYRRRIHKDFGIYLGPMKDGNDHAADAFGEFAFNCDISPVIEKPKPKPKELEYNVRPDGVIAGNMTVREAVEAMTKRRRG